MAGFPPPGHLTEDIHLNLVDGDPVADAQRFANKVFRIG